MANCININHPDFLKLSRESGLSRIELESQMGVWMDKNNSEEWPTLEQLGIKSKSNDLKFQNKTKIAEAGRDFKIISQYSDGTFSIKIDQKKYEETKARIINEHNTINNHLSRLEKNPSLMTSDIKIKSDLSSLMDSTIYTYNNKLKSFTEVHYDGDEEFQYNNKKFNPDDYDYIHPEGGVGENKVASSRVLKVLKDLNDKQLEDGLGYLDLWISKEGVDRTKNEIEHLYKNSEFEKRMFPKELVPSNKGYVIEKWGSRDLGDVPGSGGAVLMYGYYNKRSSISKNSEGKYVPDAYMLIDDIGDDYIAIRYTVVDKSLRGKKIANLLLEQVRKDNPNKSVHRTMITNPIIVLQSAKINGSTGVDGDLISDIKTIEQAEKWLENNSKIIIPPLNNTKFKKSNTKEGVSELFESNPGLSEVGNEQQYSQYLDSLNNPNTNPILKGNQEEQVKKFAELQERLNNKEFLKGAKFAYESSEGLKSFGTQEQYNDYIARVSLGIVKNPSSGEYNYDSKVKDIVYHGSNVKFDFFNLKSHNRANLTKLIKKGFYFSDLYTAKSYAPEVLKNEVILGNEIIRVLDRDLKNGIIPSSETESVYYEIIGESGIIKDKKVEDIPDSIDALNKYKDLIRKKETLLKSGVKSSFIYSVVLNLENPKIIDSNKDTVSETIEKQFINNDSIKNNDSIIFNNVDDIIGERGISTTNTLTVFKPEQIHILGSKQDINGFKAFVNKNVQFNKETLSEEKTYKSLSAEENVIKTLSNRLSNKFGIKHEFISETKAKQLLGDKYNGESGFYYQGKTYFVKGKLSEKTTIHEFGHPFIDAIFAYNKDLFNNLYSKLERTSEGKELVALVRSLYPEYLNTKGEIINDDFYKEVMVRSLTEASLSKTSSESKFMAVINKIMHTISKLLKFSSNKKGELDKLSVDTTIEELAKLFMNDTKMVLKTSNGETILFNKEGSIQDSIVDSILKIQKDAKLITERNGKEVHEYDIKAKPFKYTFSQIAKDENQKKSFTKPTENAASKIGTLVHSFAENATKFIVNPEGESAYKESLSLINRAIYPGVKIRINSLIKTITDEDAKNGLGTPRFLSEVTIFDNTLVWYDADGKKHIGGAAGTIDLLVVHADGSVSIYDFKTSKYDTISAKSLAIYDRQLSLMKQTLAKGIPMYGLAPITEFKKTRLIPIKVSYAKNKTTSEMELSNATFANDQIPVAGESTGNKGLDEKLKDWTNKLNNMLKHQYDGDELVKAERAKKITMLRALLTKLNIKKNIVDVLEDIEALVSQIEVSMSKKTEDLTMAEINAHRDDLKAYVNISILANLDIDNEDRLRIERLSGRVDSLTTLITRRNEDLISKEMAKSGFNSNEVAFGITGYEANFRELSQYNNPHLNYFYRQVQGKLNQTRIDSDKFREKLVDVTEKLRKFAGSHGGMGDVFDWMINQDGHALKLINKLSDEFFQTRDKAIDNKDEAWLNENVHLDLDEIKAEYKRRLDANSFDPKTMSKLYADYKADADAFWNKNKSLKSASKKYLIVNDSVAEKWHSKEYSKLLQKGNEPALNFYNFYVNSMNEFKKFLPDVGQGETFMAQIRADFLEQASKMNKDSIEYTKEMAREMVSFRQNEDITMGVYENGQRSYTVPIFYTQKIESNKASKDLARSLQMFAEMAYKYKAMSELEAESIGILESLKTKKAYETSWTGNVVTKSGEKVTSEEANKNYVNAMVDYMNYYLYGITTKEQGPIGPIVKTLSNWNAKSKLSFNLMSGVIAWTANAIGLVEETIKSTYFSGEEFRKANMDLSSANTDGYALMRFFEANSETAFKTKGGKGTREMLNKKLSKHWVLGAVNPDLMFEALRSADRFAFGSVTLAMARNHTIDSNGNIVSFKTIRKNKLPVDFYESGRYTKAQRDSIEKGIEEYIKTLPTIRDSVVYKDGEMSFKGNTPTDEAVLGFKNKVREVVRNTTGSIDNDNVSRIRMSAMWRAGMLFKNWMPRAYDKRYGGLRKNIAADAYEMGRYRTFMGKMFSKVIDDAGESHIALTMGVEKYAVMKYNELVINGLTKGITQNEFVELTKANIRASIYSIAISGLAILGLLALGKYEDDDDEKNAAFLHKYLKRNVAELMMWVNPAEFIQIFKSPTVIIAPLDETYKFMKAITGETYGQVVGDETIIRRNNPLYYASKMAPGGALLRTLMDGSKEIERFMKSRDDELIGD